MSKEQNLVGGVGPAKCCLSSEAERASRPQGTEPELENHSPNQQIPNLEPSSQNQSLWDPRV